MPYAKGVLRHVEVRPAHDGYQESRVLTVEEILPSGKPIMVDVSSEDGKGLKVGEKFEVQYREVNLKNGGIMRRAY
jgi:hypothetical protein